MGLPGWWTCGTVPAWHSWLAHVARPREAVGPATCSTSAVDGPGAPTRAGFLQAGFAPQRWAWWRHGRRSAFGHGLAQAGPTDPLHPTCPTLLPDPDPAPPPGSPLCPGLTAVRDFTPASQGQQDAAPGAGCHGAGAVIGSSVVFGLKPPAVVASATPKHWARVAIVGPACTRTQGFSLNIFVTNYWW